MGDHGEYWGPVLVGVCAEVEEVGCDVGEVHASVEGVACGVAPQDLGVVP